MQTKSYCNGKLPNCISANFNLDELSKTSTGVANTPSEPSVINNLRKVAENILEPVRKHFDRKVLIHSGYRSAAVNKAVGGSNNSQHSHGEAVDFSVQGYTVHEVANWIKDNLTFDQLILEHYLHNSLQSGWVHCSYSHNNRHSVLTKFKGSQIYYPGILLEPPSKGSK
jgi:zinc D-Ala-D-Ala carboxypeptidase